MNLRRLVNTIASVALSLILALIVWAGATSAENPSVTQAFARPIPIEVRNQPPDTVIVSRVETSIQVRLNAPQNTWPAIGTGDLEAYVDLSSVPIGQEVEVPVAVRIKKPGVRLVEQTPSLMTMRLENLEVRTVPVRANVIDTPPLGFVTRDPVTEPNEVQISGAAPAVARVAYVGVDVWLRGATETINRSLAPTPLDKDSLPITGVTVTPATVNVTVEVAQRTNFKPSVPVRVNLVGEPAPLYSVSSIAVNPSRVTLLGLPAVLEQIPGYIDTEAIDITDATESISKRVSLSLPPGVSIVPESAEATQTVQVDIEIVPIITGRTMQVTVTAQGLAPGQEATLSPPTVDVVLSGPLAQLQNLTGEEIEVTVNLVDLQLGTHRLTPTVIAPPGIEVKGVLPEAVEADITGALITPEPATTATTGTSGG